MKLLFIILFYFKGVFYLKANGCSSVVTSDTVVYKGCKEFIETDSLTNSAKDSIPIYSFKGIPYAEPPVGSLRFQKTIPKTYSRQTYIEATDYKNPCMQITPTAVRKAIASILPSEDCLYLNVWTPTLNSSANLPVMFWIHGGGFWTGSGSPYIQLFLSTSNTYEGNRLALRNVVVITFNYRLGVFGFLYGNSSDAPGNQGIWDQAMALNWTKQNIRAFGGNPNEMTIFGESAGSASVSYHIVSNVTRNWFNRAILQSGSAYSKLLSRDKEYSYEIARKFASNSTLALTGSCHEDKYWIQCLRNKSAAELLLAQVLAFKWNPLKPWYSGWIQTFVPIFGDEFMPISVNRAVKEGNFRKDIKLLIGHNEMEGALLIASFDILRGLLGRYLPPLPISPLISKRRVYFDIKNIFIDNDTIGIPIAEKFLEHYSENSYILYQNSIRKSAVHLFGNYLLTCPTILFGGHIVKNSLFTGKVFQYRLTHVITQSISKLSVWAEATHADDLPLLFGQPFKPIEWRFWSSSDRKLSKQIMDIWTHFAKYDELPIVNGNVWPAYSLNSDNSVNATYLELHSDSYRLGKVYVNGYDGVNDGYNPSVIGNCFNFWDVIFSDQF